MKITSKLRSLKRLENSANLAAEARNCSICHCDSSSKITIRVSWLSSIKENKTSKAYPKDCLSKTWLQEITPIDLLAYYLDIAVLASGSAFVHSYPLSC